MKKTKAPKTKTVYSAPTLDFEVGVGFPRVLVAGVDEVGRGCLAGEVVAGACVLHAAWGEVSFEELKRRHPELARVTDSKQLSASEREELAPWIRANVLAYGIGAASVDEIDRVNIFQASHLAMVRAVENLRDPVANVPVYPRRLLVDGKFLPRVWQSHPYAPEDALRASAIVKGDLRSVSIACASILAKVHRDQEIAALDEKYPGYGFAVHKGYATPAHQAALRLLGPCEIHRKSFAPVKALLSTTVGEKIAEPVAHESARDRFETEDFFS